MSQTPPESSNPKPRVAIVGAGISGLTAAWNLAKQGYEVDIYDGKSRAGGVIYTDENGMDKCAEIIGSKKEQPAIHQLASELGIGFKPAMGNINSTYLLSNGAQISEAEFDQAYLPIAEQVAMDRQIIMSQPNGERAQHINNLSVDAYIDELAENANAKQQQSWLQWMGLTAMPPAVSAEILQAAKQIIATEFLTSSQTASALQYINESGEPGNGLMAAEDGFRIDSGNSEINGTGYMIEVMEEKLKEHGVNFHTGQKITAIDKQAGKFGLTDAEGKASGNYDQLVMAVDAHQLPNIQGLEHLGFSEDMLNTLSEVQYTQGVKVTIKTKQKLPEELEGYGLSANGYQSWSKDREQVTFFVNSELASQMKGWELREYLMQDYAKARGMDAEALFDTSYNHNPLNVNNPGYASPGPGQVLAMEQLSSQFDQLATQQGIAVIGSYLPSHQLGHRSYGFMDTGIESANRGSQLLQGHMKSVAAARHLNYQVPRDMEANQIPANSPQSGLTI